jgi:biopolymer transport protein ExbB
MWFDPALWSQALKQFFLSGGWVLFWLAWTALVMWTLLLERTWFRWVQFPALKRACLKAVSARENSGQGEGRLITQVAGLERELQKSFSLIKTLVALCPMIGLLGTVTGMIQVFDVLAFHGTGNPRLMSAGVAKATIPTMAGMVLAVSGLLMFTWLHHWSRLQLASLAHMNDGK